MTDNRNATNGNQQVDRASLLLSTTQAFCKEFISGAPPSSMLDRYFTSNNPKITEHGPPWANERLPFVAKTFTGRRPPLTDQNDPDAAAKPSGANGGTSCDDYFETLGAMLSFHPHENSLPPTEGYVVDPNTDYWAGRGGGAGGRGVVMVKVHAGLAGIKSRKSWEEDFIMVFSDFDEDGKIGHKEIWADNLSAFMGVEESKGVD